MRNLKDCLVVLSLVFISLTYVSCDEDNTPKDVDNLEKLQQTVSEEVLNKFEDDKVIEISKIDIDKADGNYIYEAFEVDYWIYDVYNENGQLLNRAYNFYGLNASNVHSTIKSSLVLSFNIGKSILGKNATEFECGKANMIYENEDNFKSEQYIINVVSSKNQNFDIENNETKFYITNGTGALKDKKGFAYMKIENEIDASFGCYPNSKNYPDDFEDGTCALFNSCATNCAFGNGKAKLYILGVILEEEK